METVILNCLVCVAFRKSKKADNISYPPAGITAKEMISLHLKKAAQAQILLTNPAGG